MALLALAVLLITGPGLILGQTSSNPPDSLGKREVSAMEALSEFWVFRLFLNLIGYGSLMLPGYLLIRWLRTSKYLDRAGVYSSVPLCHFFT